MSLSNRRLTKEVRRLQRRNVTGGRIDKWGQIPGDNLLPGGEVEFFKTAAVLEPTDGDTPGMQNCRQANFDGTDLTTTVDNPYFDVYSMFPIAASTFFMAVKVGRDRFAVAAAHKARWIEFHLDEALATTDSDCNATVDAFHDGVDPGSSITLYNKSASSNYIFEGSNNDKGIALYSPNDDRYTIVQLECS